MGTDGMGRGGNGNVKSHSWSSLLSTAVLFSLARFFVRCDHDNSRTAALRFMKFFKCRYLDNL